MNILLTGHLGYVGSVLAPLLMERGHQLRGMDAGWFESSQLFPVSTRVQQALHQDIRDARAADFADIEVVIHLAGLSNDPLGSLDATLTDEINHRAAVRLAILAKSAGVRRFVATSSCSIYGAAGDQWIAEDSLPAPVTPYGHSKLAMERGLARLDDPHFEVVIARPGTVFGESPMLRFDLVLNNLVAWAMATGRIRFKSNGTAWRPLLHVHNLGEALAFLAEAPAQDVAGNAFNVGFNSQNLQVSELGAIIQSVLPNAIVETVEDSSDVRSYRVDCSRLEQRWQPPSGIITLKAGVQRLVDCLRLYPVGPDDFEGCKYQRLAHLQFAMQQGWMHSRLGLNTLNSNE